MSKMFVQCISNREAPTLAHYKSNEYKAVRICEALLYILSLF